MITRSPILKKLFIRTYGCQMNVYDSDRMADLLKPVGYTTSAQVEDAELIVLNTCHIREKAAEKVYSELGRLRILKEERAAQGKDTTIVVAGCVAQAEGEEIIRRAPVVDMVVGPQSYHRLPEMIARASRTGGAILETDFPPEDKFDALPKEVSVTGVSAFLTIQEGCDKFCTFCVVPYTRGAEYSRPVAQIITEAKALVAGGAREITLLGQNVNAYHGAGPDGENWGLGPLIRNLAKLRGLERLRYTTSHPRDMDDELIQAHGEIEELMPYLHLPVQAGSDRILKAMNRSHTAQSYLDLIKKIRTARPDIALSGDFIVGFPGESDEDFQATLALIAEVKYASAFSFKYSSRPGTPGAALPNQVPEDVKTARLAELQTLIRSQQESFNAACIGLVLPVLVEKDGRYPGQKIGRSPYLQSVHFMAPEAETGSIIKVRIDQVHTNSLAGILVEKEADAA